MFQRRAPLWVRVPAAVVFVARFPSDRRGLFTKSSHIKNFFAWSVATTKLEQSRQLRKRKEINKVRGLTKQNKNSKRRNNVVKP